MGEWKKVKIEDLGTVVGGSTPSTRNPKNYEGGTIAWITPKDLSVLSGRFISHGERDITEIGLKSCSTKLMPAHTVLFSSRAPIGYIAIAEQELCTNQGFKSIIPNSDTDFMFLYYLLKYNKNNIEHLGSGTTFKEVSGSTMKKIEVKVPDLETQKKIAKILSSIDDKIELNQKINENLQNQAQAIYDFMFIKNVDYSWANGILSDIAVITMGQSPKGETYNEDKVGTVFFQGKAEFGFRFPTRKIYTTEPKRMAQINDILMSVRAPVGDINVAYEDCCIGRGLSAIKSKDNCQAFLLYTMFAIHQQLDMFNGEGTVFGAINKDSLNSIPVTIPPNKLISQFEEIVKPIDKMIRNNYSEICHLESIRDTLLPRLMSGELDVSNVELKI